jgi:hypothetical protein
MTLKSLPCTFATLLITLASGQTMAAEPLAAETMDSIQITSPTLPACHPSKDKAEANCMAPAQLNELTSQSIKETQESSALPQNTIQPIQQLPQTPDVTPLQQQIMEDFTQRPWGR